MCRVIDKYEQLQQCFGYSSFRPGQEELVDALLAGRDVLGVMPTGAGKSICYQLPSLMLPGSAVVVSPLISLMKDQVTALAQSGIHAAYINSSLTAAQYREVLRRAGRGAYKILYVAPERLTTPDFLQLTQDIDISLLAVDEAHCVSQWGQDFRPSYLKIARFIEVLPARPVVGAFTATATAAVKKDIEKLLLLREPLRITTGFDRPNLYFEVASPRSKETYTLAYVAERAEQSGVIYCSTRKNVESVCEALQQNGIQATRYHAGLTDEERRQNQEDFVFDRVRVMVATNAFGMGIDKSNISYVLHYNMPKNVESYYQEAGRAGRDGAAAQCVLLFSLGDIQTAKFLINHNPVANEDLSPEEQEMIRQGDLRRLEQMVGYCKTSTCLRAYILRYFGEKVYGNCGNCGNCKGEYTHQDITIEAQKILSGVARVEKKYSYSLGMTTVIQMLRGSKDRKVLQRELNKLPTYGIMSGSSRTQVREYMDYLIREGYLDVSEDEYHVLHITERARQVLFHGEWVIYPHRKQSKLEKAIAQRSAGKAEEVLPAKDETLFDKLKRLRSKLAQKESIPAYLIFSNATLADMVIKQPQSMGEFLRVSGVGEVKAERYGEAFLAEITAWRKEKMGKAE